ncbi:MAG: PAS domain S-box protein [Paludibacter sp.]|nr:PAS domain S-box protein [Paludibacter sp.]
MRKTENRKLKILYLEDSKRDYEIIYELLIDHGFIFDMKFVENKKDFRKMLLNEDFDIILSDFTLPDFDAFEALKLTLKIKPQIPFIVVSGSIGEEIAIELIKKGAVDYILKDRIERLPIAITRAIDEKFIKNAHQKAEQDLAREQYLMFTLMENIPDHIFFKNLKSEFILLSKSQVISYGLKNQSEVLGKTDFDFYEIDHAQLTFDDEQKIIETAGPLIEIEEKTIRKDGSEAWASTTKMPLYSSDGKIIGTFGISKDITERKKNEAEIAKRIADLEYYQSFVINRELKMIELKKEINDLLNELGRPKKYW